MQIRRAEERDIPGMIRLLYQVGGVHHQIRPELFRSGAIKYTESDLKALLRDENAPIFAAVEEDYLVGYCFCQLRDYRDSTVLTDRKEIYIDDLCVEETCRGQGIAKALYSHVCGWARDLGCSFVTLNVWCGNDGAMKFYERMGMKQRSITMETPL